MKQICILGSTGSIGSQTLEVVRNNTEEFQIIALTAGNNIKLLAEQIEEFHPHLVAVKTPEGAKQLKTLVEQNPSFEGKLPEIYVGMDGFIQCATHPQVDLVVAAMVGMIGLQPVIKAMEHKKNIALANKETLVTAGHLIMDLKQKYQVNIYPVDSEHSAIFQCLQSGKQQEIEQIYLTASGGPFRELSREQLSHVTVEDALAHPNWSMGKKITIDSATMINKGLEIIEACWLFDVPIDKIHVLVQPDSVIHSMVEFQDGAVIAQMGTPDMKLPIQYAMFYPKRVFLGGERLDFEAMGSLHFAKPNPALRGIELASEAFRSGGTMPTVMNAANEYAVAKFLNHEISFLDIYRWIEYAMKHHVVSSNPSLEEILKTEQETYHLLEKDRNVIS